MGDWQFRDAAKEIGSHDSVRNIVDMKGLEVSALGDDMVQAIESGKVGHAIHPQREI